MTIYDPFFFLNRKSSNCSNVQPQENKIVFSHQTLPKYWNCFNNSRLYNLSRGDDKEVLGPSVHALKDPLRRWRGSCRQLKGSNYGQVIAMTAWLQWSLKRLIAMELGISPCVRRTTNEIIHAHCKYITKFVGNHRGSLSCFATPSSLH